jgi:glycine dehydrogenase subunit 1
VDLVELMVQRTAYARRRLSEVPGVTLLHDGPVVREFAISLQAPAEEVLAHCRRAGINAGYPLARDYPELGEALLVALTERRTREDIDRLVDALQAGVASSVERTGVPA